MSGQIEGAPQIFLLWSQTYVCRGISKQATGFTGCNTATKTAKSPQNTL